MEIEMKYNKTNKKGNTMKCPFCGKNMDVGYIASSGDITWTPKGKKSHSIVNCLKPYEVCLSNTNYFGMTKLKTYRCAECKKVLIDESDKKV